MDGVETDFPEDSQTYDFCEAVLSRFSASMREDHQRICAVIGAMSQELKDQNLPSNPVAYFGAVCSSLDHLSSSLSASTDAHAIEALSTILSLVLPRIPVPVVNKKREFLSELLVRVLRMSSVTDGTVLSALKCVSHLLTIRDSVKWSDFSQLYGILLEFMIDSRPEVRRRAHVCIREVLQSLRGTPAMASSCEGFTNSFERFLLLAGGSNSDAGEGHSGGALEVLYILDALKECLPLMTVKYTSTFLKYYKTLLELKQSVVTWRITDSLNMLCQQPMLDVSAELLLDLLCSLAISASTNETSADNLAITASLLDIGMRKIYSLNRQICVIKLPIIFSTLKDILTSEHEEAIFAAAEALKSLIRNCVDDNLIRQGVDQIKMNNNRGTSKVCPTIIEKVCATMESLLDYHYHAICDVVFQVVSVMFDKLGQYSSYFMRGTLKNLEDMQRLPDEDFPFRKQLHECVGSAVCAMGPEIFSGFLPLNLEADDLSQVNVWLFPILKQYIVGARLSFFRDTILGSIEFMKQKSRKLEHEGRIVAARSVDALVYSLWSLLPSFCSYPLDTSESFEDLKEPLSHVLVEETAVRGIICSALQTLIQQNSKILEEGDDMSGGQLENARQRARARYSPEVKAENLNVLRSSAHHFLTVIARIFLESVKDDGGCLQSTIREFASIADKNVVKRIFLRTMRQLLEVTQRAAIIADTSGNTMDNMQIDDSSNENSQSIERARLFDLAASLLPGLGDNEIGVLLSVVKPAALQDGEGLIQKKAYKVLSIILQKSDGLLSSRIEELLQLMIDGLPLCHFSAKQHRLDCLYFLIVLVSKENSEKARRDIISSFLTEIILALKEANKKTRNRAYEVLVQIGHACGDEENGGKRENLFNFFNMVAGGLAGETPHMVSAAMKGLARLAYEFSDLISTSYKLLPSTFLLLQRKNREIAKANLGFIKVLVAKSQSEGLHMHLGSMVEGLLKWQDDTKNHFKAKVKHLLEMLVRKCGLEAVKAVMPEEHMKLLTNIRKIKERKERKLASNSEETKSHLSRATTSRISRWNHTRIFSDMSDEEAEDSEVDYMDTKTTSGRQSKASSKLKSKTSSLRSKRFQRLDKSLREDLFDQIEDEPLDLLDRSKTRSALRSSELLKRKQESDDEPEIDPEGRLIIREGVKPKKDRPFDADFDARSDAGSFLSNDSRKTQKRRKTSAGGWAYTGNEYASKKAGGDVTRKDKLEPYAYWPLDRKMMSRRPEHRSAARKGMASVVKMTKKLEGKSASGALSMKFMKFKNIQKKGSKRKGT